MEYTLITGATGGLGKEFCRQLVATDNLFLTGRNKEKLEDLRLELLKINPNAEIEIFPADVTSEDGRKALFDYATEKNAVFSGLMNVAGVDTQKAFDKYTQEKLVFQVRVNVEATLSITRFVIERRAEKLKILTVGSMSGTTPMPYFAIYSASKAFLLNFFTSLRYEVKNAKITTLVPGGIPTRPDIINDIKVQGVTGKMSSKPATFVVKKALKALNKNKRKVIPGAFNKFVYFLERITPLSIQCRYIARKWGKKEKDHF